MLPPAEWALCLGPRRPVHIRGLRVIRQVDAQPNFPWARDPPGGDWLLPNLDECGVSKTAGS
jgi:hypothetical protein